MLDRLNPEALFLEHLGWIEKVATIACHKHSLWGDEADEFVARAKMKLIEDDYAAIRQFRGESALRTYLATVVVRHFHEYGRERRGRWRPSAAAERLGGVAKELETLVYRDGYRLDQAGEKLRTSGRTSLSDAELARVLARLPVREPLRPVEVGPEPIQEAPDAGAADARVVAAEAEARRRAVMDALTRALARLEPEERMIVRMHFGEGRTLADVARALHLEQKPLYRRVDRLRARLRAFLEEDGVSEGGVRELLGEEDAA